MSNSKYNFTNLELKILRLVRDWTSKEGIPCANKNAQSPFGAGWSVDHSWLPEPIAIGWLLREGSDAVAGGIKELLELELLKVVKCLTWMLPSPLQLQRDDKHTLTIEYSTDSISDFFRVRTMPNDPNVGITKLSGEYTTATLKPYTAYQLTKAGLLAVREAIAKSDEGDTKHAKVKSAKRTRKKKTNPPTKLTNRENQLFIILEDDARKPACERRSQRAIANDWGVGESRVSTVKKNLENKLLAIGEYRNWFSKPEPRGSRSIDHGKAEPLHDGMY